MTDDLPQLVSELRSIASQNVCDLPNMGDEAHEPPEITWGELDAIGRTADAAATALDTITRAIAEQRAALARAHGWLGECYAFSGADPDSNEDWRLAPYAAEEVARLRREFDAAESALIAMTHERDEARALAGRQSMALAELGDKCSDEFNRAESATAAVREARAETEQLRREVNYQRARAVDAEARLAAESVRATAARASQP